MSVHPQVLAALRAARAAERAQAHFYRSLAAQAEAVGDPATAERLNGLHADEQHHLSRLTVRLVELEQRLEELHAGSGAAPTVDEWESAAREREIAEIERYEALLRLDLDVETADLIRSILDAERRHATELGGKWMEA